MLMAVVLLIVMVTAGESDDDDGDGDEDRDHADDGASLFETKTPALQPKTSRHQNPKPQTAQNVPRSLGSSKVDR